jgi:hypothetical protein
MCKMMRKLCKIEFNKYKVRLSKEYNSDYKIGILKINKYIYKDRIKIINIRSVKEGECKEQEKHNKID